MKDKAICICILATCVSGLNLKCKKPPYIAEFFNVKGYVIAKEVCNQDESKDYWLIDLTYSPDTPRYGDTITLNTITYTNVVKVQKLAPELKKEGKRVSLDFKSITEKKIVIKGCDVNTQITYDLKELFIINQGEIR